MLKNNKYFMIPLYNVARIGKFIETGNGIEATEFLE
jgi:hypothetical protein